VAAHKNLHDAIGLLLGAPLDEVGTWEPQPRSAWIAGAFARLDSARSQALAAQPFLQSAENGTVNPLRKDDFLRARTVWIPSMVGYLDRFNRTMDYLDPAPVDTPQIVGPHGTHIKAGTKMVLALRFLAERKMSSRMRQSTSEICESPS
jgi:hypothetical protein